MPPTLWHEGAGIGVRLEVRPRARRLTLRLEAGGDAVLSRPPTVGEAEARAFLDRHSSWLCQAVAARPAPVVVGPGMALPVAGRLLEVVHTQAGQIRVEGARLLVAPGRKSPAARLAEWLKLQARTAITPKAEDYAARLGKPIAAIAFRDTRTRWGSCSSAARLSFSWRLAMAPPAVQDYVAAHEAAHLVEMNHSPRYWAVLAGLMPEYAQHRAWLRREGRALHRYRFEDGVERA